MFFLLILVLISSPIFADQWEDMLNNLKDGYNKADTQLFSLNFSEKNKKNWDDKRFKGFFQTTSALWGSWKTYNLPPKQVEKNVYEIETKFEKGWFSLKLYLSEDYKIDDFSFDKIKKIDFENPKISSTKLLFPLKGNWIVKEGGANLEKNIFKDTYDKGFALYLQKVDEKGNIINSMDADVLSPVEANVWQIIDNIPDNEPPEINTFRPNGNSIVLKISEEEFLAITNLKQGSFKVKPGQKVKVGDVLAKTGFSGNISEPMVGLWVQTNVLEQEGEGIKFYFSCVEKFDGKNWAKKENYFPEKGDILRTCSQ